MRVLLIGAPAGFEAELLDEPKILRAGPRERDLDLIQAFFTRRAHLEKNIARLRPLLGPRAKLWICYPRARALATDLNRAAVRSSSSRVGFQVGQAVAIDPVWTAVGLKRV